MAYSYESLVTYLIYLVKFGIHCHCYKASTKLSKNRKKGRNNVVGIFPNVISFLH